MAQPDLAFLVAAREAAWAELDALQRDLPDCEHVRAWRQELHDAARRHREAIRAADRAMADTARPRDQESGGEPLFEMQEAV